MTKINKAIDSIDKAIEIANNINNALPGLVPVPELRDDRAIEAFIGQRWFDEAMVAIRKRALVGQPVPATMYGLLADALREGEYYEAEFWRWLLEAEPLPFPSIVTTDEGAIRQTEG